MGDGSSEIGATCYLAPITRGNNLPKIINGQLDFNMKTKWSNMANRFTCTQDTHCAGAQQKMMCDRQYTDPKQAAASCLSLPDCIGMVRYKVNRDYKWETLAKAGTQPKCNFRNFSNKLFFNKERANDMITPRQDARTRPPTVATITNERGYGCVRQEECSATWGRKLSFMCSATYNDYEFAKSMCYPDDSCDAVLEVNTPYGVHWELASRSEPPCPSTNEYTIEIEPKERIIVPSSNSVLDENAIAVGRDMILSGMFLTCASGSQCLGNESDFRGNASKQFMCNKSYTRKEIAIEKCKESMNCLGLLIYLIEGEIRYQPATMALNNTTCPRINDVVQNINFLYRQYF